MVGKSLFNKRGRTVRRPTLPLPADYRLLQSMDTTAELPPQATTPSAISGWQEPAGGPGKEKGRTRRPEGVVG